MTTPSNLLIDTGASVSLVNTKLVAQVGGMEKISPTNIVKAGLDNVIVPTKGEICLPIKFGNMKIQHTFVVCNELEHDFLVGMDILTNHKITLDIPNANLYTPMGKENFIEKPVSLKNRLIK